jgi:hypothetical protein
VQCIGDLDDPQFETATEIKFLGGNAEGVFLVGDGKRSIVVKPADEADRTVLAYNLAKDFQVKIPSARQVTLESAQGSALFERAAVLEKTGRLARGFKAAGSAILMDYVEGERLDKLRSYSSHFNNEASLETLGRMLVFDVAVLNIDRFKLESTAPINPGNLLVTGQGPIGIDQDFAKINSADFGNEDSITEYGPRIVGTMADKLKNPETTARELVKKLISQAIPITNEETARAAISRGIAAGVHVLKGLLASTTRIEQLVRWAETFVRQSSLKSEEIREYWRALAAVPERI